MNALLISLIYFFGIGIQDSVQEIRKQRLQSLKDFAEISKKYTKDSDELKNVVKRLQRELKETKKAAKATKDQKRQSIESIEAEIRLARSRKMVVFPSIAFADQFRVGGMGTFEQGDVTVFQVIDENTSIITFQLQRVVGYRPTRIELGDSVKLMVKGVDTIGVADGGQANHVVPGLFEITGNQTYQTARGTNTIFVAEPVSQKDCATIQELANPQK